MWLIYLRLTFLINNSSSRFSTPHRKVGNGCLLLYPRGCEWGNEMRGVENRGRWNSRDWSNEPVHNPVLSISQRFVTLIVGGGLIQRISSVKSFRGSTFSSSRDEHSESLGWHFTHRLILVNSISFRC